MLIWCYNIIHVEALNKPAGFSASPCKVYYFLSCHFVYFCVLPSWAAGSCQWSPGEAGQPLIPECFPLHIAQCHIGVPQAPYYKHWLEGGRHRWLHALSRCPCQPQYTVVILNWIWHKNTLSTGRETICVVGIWKKLLELLKRFA